MTHAGIQLNIQHSLGGAAGSATGSLEYIKNFVFLKTKADPVSYISFPSPFSKFSMMLLNFCYFNSNF